VIAGCASLRTNAPVFYYRDRDRETGEPRPLTRKRFELLWGRLKRELTWLDEIHGRPHDLRKTMGTFIERAYGHAVAKRWLRHSVGDTTGIHTAADEAEVEGVHRWLLGNAS
jgi:integrase